MNEELLELIQQRSQKNTFSGRGIMTADQWVKSLESCVGTDLCYRYAAKGNVSFSDLLKAAKKTLTYSNDEMEVEDVYGAVKSLSSAGL